MSLRAVRSEHVRAQFLTGNAGDTLDMSNAFQADKHLPRRPFADRAACRAEPFSRASHRELIAGNPAIKRCVFHV